MASQKISYLYFLVDAEYSAFKVGVSSNPIRRIAALPEKIDFAKSLQFSCDRLDVFRVEKTIHFLFSGDRCAKPVGNGYTEWFSITAFEKILDFVLSNQDKFKWIDYGPIDPGQPVASMVISKPKTSQGGSKTPVSRRGFMRYKENPSLSQASGNSRAGTRRISNVKGDKMLIVSQEAMEIIAPTGFHETAEADRTQLVRLYIDEIGTFQGLTSTGIRVFEFIFLLVQQNPGIDELTLHYSVVEKHKFDMSPATFKRGMRELLEKGFIYESMTPNLYWLNIDYLFNGNRLAFIKEFRLKEKQERVAKLFGQ